MLKKPAYIGNPLTVIGVFASITEVAATVLASLGSEPLQIIMVWFIVLFPTALCAAFFLTLNLNPKVLYAPRDFRRDQHFMETIFGQQRTIKQPPAGVTISAEPGTASTATSQLMKLWTSPSAGQDAAPKISADVPAALKGFFNALQKALSVELKGKLAGISIKPSDKGEFAIDAIVAEEFRATDQAHYYMEGKVYRNLEGNVEFELEGWGIKCTDPEEFAWIAAERIKSALVVLAN